MSEPAIPRPEPTETDVSAEALRIRTAWFDADFRIECQRFFERFAQQAREGGFVPCTAAPERWCPDAVERSAWFEQAFVDPLTQAVIALRVHLLVVRRDRAPLLQAYLEAGAPRTPTPTANVRVTFGDMLLSLSLEEAHTPACGPSSAGTRLREVLERVDADEVLATLTEPFVP